MLCGVGRGLLGTSSVGNGDNDWHVAEIAIVVCAILAITIFLVYWQCPPYNAAVRLIENECALPQHSDVMKLEAVLN